VVQVRGPRLVCCAVLPSDDATGCSPVRKRAANAPQRSTPSSRPARPMASTRRPTSSTSMGRSQLIGQRRDGTSLCPGTGLRKPWSQWRKPRDPRPPGTLTFNLASWMYQPPKISGAIFDLHVSDCRHLRSQCYYRLPRPLLIHCRRSPLHRLSRLRFYSFVLT
jgi:hypothetical protein